MQERCPANKGPEIQTDEQTEEKRGEYGDYTYIPDFGVYHADIFIMQEAIVAEKRGSPIGFRPSAEELEIIKRKMTQMGMHNRGAYLRKMALDGYCVNIDMSDIREIARLLRICSNNLNQYARIANITGTVYKGEIDDLRKRLDEIWDLTKKVMEMLAVIT